MNINAISSVNSYSANYSNQNKVAFKGRIGDQFVGKLERGMEVKVSDILGEVKGTFGLKSEKVEDVIESLINKIKSLNSEKISSANALNEAKQKIHKFPEEKTKAVNDARSEIIEAYESRIKKYADETLTAKQEAKKAKEFAEKFEPMSKVKSIEELDVILPEQAIKVADEVIENRVAANKSMFEFLMTGKGQEEALKQMERNNILLKARIDGIEEIPAVKSKIEEVNKHYLHVMYPIDRTINMIKNALKGAPNGNYILSSKIQENVKKNAMALLAPLSNKQQFNGIENITKNLDEAIKEIIKFHKDLPKGIERIRRQNSGAEIIENKLSYDPHATCVAVKLSNGQKVERSFEDVAYLGQYY